MPAPLQYLTLMLNLLLNGLLIYLIAVDRKRKTNGSLQTEVKLEYPSPGRVRVKPQPYAKPNGLRAPKVNDDQAGWRKEREQIDS
jgi:hypothetical protein